MDYLASFQLLPLRLAGNQLIANVPSPDGVTNRTNLLYRLDIYRPKSFRSGEYVIHEKLRGREAPPVVENSTIFSDGCNFDLSEFIWGLLEANPPVPNQTEITLQPLATMPFFVRRWVEPYQVSTQTDEPIEYLIRAKLHEDHFASWKESFFTNYLQENRAFLTWQPRSEKIIDRNQPEFLSFLTHHNPLPSALKVRVQVTFTDETTSETLTPIELKKVENYTLYTIPVGFQALGLANLEQEKNVLYYKVWLSNHLFQQLTEERVYYVSNDYEHHVRYVVFLNSLGGWDTLRMTGLSNEQLQTSVSIMQRQLEPNYSVSSDEIFTVNITGERRLTLYTGNLSRPWLKYLEELVWSEKIFVVTADGFVPIIINQNSFDGPNEDDDFSGRVFQFRQAKVAKAYSELPASPTSNTNRPTQWVGVGAYCMVNEKGLRTGFQSFSLLELRYSDGAQERVPGIKRQANIPTNNGYIAPLISLACQSSPYLNTRIERFGTFQKNNCGDGYIGSYVTIVVEAGTHGSENSQAEAQARAESTWNLLNTQEAANANGVCSLGYRNTAISRQSTYTRNTCTNGLAGSKWTIVIPEGQFISAISQADADAQANAQANALDTQANADLYGACGWYNQSLSRKSLATRQNCSSGLSGSNWTIQLGANQFFSTISQADANAQAEVHMTQLDTQANANLYGACGWYNQEFQINSQKRKNNCAPGQIGGGWMIVIPAGRFFSTISQQDAYNQANAEANALDTQENANLNAGCF
ncbi:hypothetical protein FHS57_006220 [Runella defluvii]|uniref:DUF5977 domain-containing protein n=1 Tax=Runella defluvii TaxID=370973 RepID=A0A7W6ETW5_9BACT|nr:DUF5977 domain-containing protein [Runella defluvii]MBB3842189.1 hypothetical protein [Runella defluvii]